MSVNIDGRGKVDTKRLTAMLRQKYSAAGWVFLPNVRSDSDRKVGMVRYADAMAMATWPSLGFELHGFEIKTSRNDFLNELRDPDKSNQIKRYCDKWWLVVADREIIRLGGVPDDWGILAPSAGKLRVIKQAPRLTAAPISRGFLACLLRNVAAHHKLQE